jgi:transcriptional regulator with XRE-family HTH domain
MPITKNALQMGINHELLKKLMQDKNLTPAIIESRRGVPEQTVKNIVNGKTGNPGIENLAPICEELDIPIEYVLFSHNKEVESKVIKDNPSAYNLKEMYEFQVAILNKAHETEINNIREHYEREVKAHEKEMCNMREHYERELKQQSEYYERIINSQEQQYERRLSDKREHIDTIMLDKKWFRLAAVFGVVAVLAIFFFIEFMTPGHGWFTFGEAGESSTGLVFAIVLLIIFTLGTFASKKKVQGDKNEK